MTEQETKIYDATLQLEAALNLAGLSYEKRSEHTYVDFGKAGYARFAFSTNKRGVTVCKVEMHKAGAKVRKGQTPITEGFARTVIRQMRKVAGGVQ